MGGGRLSGDCSRTDYRSESGLVKLRSCNKRIGARSSRLRNLTAGADQVARTWLWVLGIGAGMAGLRFLFRSRTTGESPGKCTGQSASA